MHSRTLQDRQPEYARIVSDQRILFTDKNIVQRRAKRYKINIASAGTPITISPPTVRDDAWLDICTPVAHTQNTPVISWEVRITPSPTDAQRSLDEPNYDFTNCPGQYYFNPHTESSVRVSLRELGSCVISVLANGVPVSANVILTSPCVLIF